MMRHLYFVIILLIISLSSCEFFKQEEWDSTPPPSELMVELLEFPQKTRIITKYPT